MIAFALGLLIGVQAGWWSGWVKKRLNQLLVPKPRVQTGVTRGVYKPANELAQSSAVISPKSPQKVQFETEEELRKAGYQ